MGIHTYLDRETERQRETSSHTEMLSYPKICTYKQDVCRKTRLPKDTFLVHVYSKQRKKYNENALFF